MSVTRSVAKVIVPVISGVMIVGGVVAAAASTPQDATFGWFAYAPLSEATYTPGGAVLVTWGVIAGAAVAAVGLAVLAFWAGYSIRGSRSRQQR